MAKFIKTFLILSTALLAHGHYRNHNRRSRPDDPCKLLPDRRVCNRDVNVRRFYFDNESLQCRAFEYRGCPDGNTNNFVSQWDCLRSCLLKQGSSTGGSGSLNLKGVLRDEKSPGDKLPINTSNAFTSLDLDGGSGEGEEATEKIEEQTTPAFVSYAASLAEKSTTPKPDSIDMIYDNLVPFTTPVYNAKSKDVKKATAKKQGKPMIATKKLTPQDAQRIVPPPLAFGGERTKPKSKKFKVVSQGLSPPNMGQGEPVMKDMHEAYETERSTEFNEQAAYTETDDQRDYDSFLTSRPQPDLPEPFGVDNFETQPKMTSSVLFADDNQDILKETPSTFTRTPFNKPHWEAMERDSRPGLSHLDGREAKLPSHRPPMPRGPPPRDYDNMNEAEMLIENALGPRQANPHEHRRMNHLRPPMSPPMSPPDMSPPDLSPPAEGHPIGRQAPPMMMNKPLIRTEMPLEEEHLHVAEPQTFPPACYQQVNPGPCRAMIRKWYYNSQHGRCMIFYYGGCEGNSNSFNSEEACMNVCGGLSFSPLDAPLPERRNSQDPEARRFSYSPMPGKPEMFENEEEPGRPEMPERPMEREERPEERPERPEAREIPEIVHRSEPPRNLAMPPRPENEENDKPYFASELKPIAPERPERPEQEIEPEMEQENDKKQVIEKVERVEKPLKQMWPSFLQLLHRGLYMSAWKMQHKPTPAPTPTEPEGSTFYITTTESPPEESSSIKFTDKETLVTDNHNVAPTGSTIPSKEIPTVQPQSDEEELSEVEKEEESNSTEEEEQEEEGKEEEEDEEVREDEEEENRSEPESSLESKKAKKKNKGKKMKMRIKMVLPFMRIFLNKYQQKPRERLLNNLLSHERPTMMPWGIRKMGSERGPWRIIDERPRQRPVNKNGLTVMQVFLHKTEDRTPWWSRRRPTPSYYHRDMLPLSHSFGQMPQRHQQPPQEIHNHYSTVVYRPNRPSYNFRRPSYQPQPRPVIHSVMPFNPIRFILRPKLLSNIQPNIQPNTQPNEQPNVQPDILPPAGEPNMACLQSLELGMCHGGQGRNAGFRYYYNQETRACSLFYHFGCGSNANNFASMQKCADTCRVTTPKPTNEATTEPITVTSIPEIDTEEPKMIEANTPVEEQELSGTSDVQSELKTEPKEDVSRSRVRFASEEEYATIIAILALGAAALLVLIILCSMHIFRRVKKSRATKKGSIIEAVLRAHIFGDLPSLPYGNKDMKKQEKVAPELPKLPQSSV